MASILVVEDSIDSQQLVCRALDANEISIAGSLAEARTQLDGDAHFDLILLDLSLPDGDGFDLAVELSSGGQPRIPIIYLSGSVDVRDKVTAFAMGAEDYIEKPFDTMELQARVQARLRRFESETQRESVVQLGTLRILTDEMRAFRIADGKDSEIDLSATEIRLLSAMAAFPRRLFSRDTLIEKVWRDSVVGLRTVDAHLSNLRTKLQGCGVEIESVRGLGYRVQSSHESE